MCAVLVCLLAALPLARASDAEVVVEAEGTGPPTGATVLTVDPDLPATAEVADLLERAAGAQVRRLGGLGAWAGVSLRGASFRQVQLHLDGVPLNPDGVSAVNLAELPLGALSELRVFRSRAPATYGASPVGGVVDLITRPGGAPPSGDLSVGSLWSVRGGVRGGVALAPSTDLLLAVDGLSTRGDLRFFDDGGTPFVDDDDAFRTRRNADRHQLAGLARLRHGEDARLTVLDAVVHREEGLPGPVGAPSDTARLTTTRNLAVLQGEGDVGATHLLGRAWHLVRAEVHDDRRGVGGTWRRDTFHTVGAQQTGRAAVARWAALRWSASGRWEGARTRDQAAETVGPWRQRGVFGAALDAVFAPLDGLRIVPGVDARGLVAQDGARGAVNPGLIVEGRLAPGVWLRATGGRTFRPPDLTELYGDRGALVGNADLRPEVAWTTDLGVRWDGASSWPVGVGLEATGFFREVTDRITWIQNAQQTLVPVNFGRAWVFGTELAVDLDLFGWVDVGTSLGWTETRNRADDPAVRDLQLPFVPRLSLDQRVSVHWRDIVRVGWDLHVTDGTAVDAANIRRQPIRRIHGLFLRVAPVVGAPSLEIEVRNVGDVITQPAPVDPLRPSLGTRPVPVVDFVGYPLPGRTVWITVAWTPGRRA